MFRRSPLVAAVAAASLLPLFAQAESSGLVEEVVVLASPIRDSHAAAILAQAGCEQRPRHHQLGHDRAHARSETSPIPSVAAGPRHRT